jgi:hypothetical protein
MTLIHLDIAIENSTEVRLGDIRKWMKEVDKFNLPNDYPVYECALALVIEIPEHNITPIECMECPPQQPNHDVLIVTHDCVNPPNKLAEAYDQAM